MPYATGQAVSFDALLHAITQTAVLAGWTDHGDGLLSRPGCAVKLAVPTPTELSLMGGSSVASGALLDPAPNRVRMFSTLHSNVWRPLVFPLFYDIMAWPEEIYCFINHGELGIPPGHMVLDDYQYLAWGTGNVPGLIGSGAWISGTFSGSTPTMGVGANPNSSIALAPASGNWGGSGLCSAGAIFADSSAAVNYPTPHQFSSYVHHGFTDSPLSAWALGSSNAITLGQRPLAPLLESQPSRWNEGAALLPIRAYIPRPENFISLVADLRHARNVRIDYLDPKAVYSLGTERWKIFPWFCKNLAARDGGNRINHSGTLGVAIRYDGA